jgi:hypothetical protein
LSFECGNDGIDRFYYVFIVQFGNGGKAPYIYNHDENLSLSAEIMNGIEITRLHKRLYFAAYRLAAQNQKKIPRDNFSIIKLCGAERF